MSATLTAHGDAARLIARSDFWRRSPASAGGSLGHKEWQYFCVLADDIDLLVNLSIVDRQRGPGTPAGLAEQARVLLLARTPDGRWHGDVDLCDPGDVVLQAGHVGARFGPTTLAFENGAYRLDARVGVAPVAATIELRPSARPALARSVPLGAQDPMHWFVVPRLDVTGEVRIGGATHRIHGCPGYHDHNWGRFAWGGDFAWEWAIVLAGRQIPWTVIYYRITDRGRHRAISQGVLLWRGDRHCRTFRDSELTVRGTGLLRVGHSLRVPRVMSLAIPETAADIPRRLEIETRSGNDAIDIGIDMDDCAQIGLPNDGDEGTTMISECRGRVNVSGRVRGEIVRVDGPSVIEFNRAA